MGSHGNLLLVLRFVLCELVELVFFHVLLHLMHLLLVLLL